jgi:hypothetical protein
MWGMGWIFPLIGFVFVVFCLFAMSRFFAGGAGFCGGRRYNEIENLRREVRELKGEIAKLRGKE